MVFFKSTAFFGKEKLKNTKKVDDFLLRISKARGAKASQSCRSREMLQNAYCLAIVAVDTAENGPF